MGPSFRAIVVGLAAPVILGVSFLVAVPFVSVRLLAIRSSSSFMQPGETRREEEFETARASKLNSRKPDSPNNYRGEYRLSSARAHYSRPLPESQSFSPEAFKGIMGRARREL